MISISLHTLPPSICTITFSQRSLKGLLRSLNINSFQYLGPCFGSLLWNSSSFYSGGHCLDSVCLPWWHSSNMLEGNGPHGHPKDCYWCSDQRLHGPPGLASQPRKHLWRRWPISLQLACSHSQNHPQAGGSVKSSGLKLGQQYKEGNIF